MYSIWYIMVLKIKIVRAAFYETVTGNIPVRTWLKELSAEDRKEIGEDIAAVEFTWPVGMPLVRSMKKGLWEVRSNLPSNRIARVLFCVVDDRMVLLHAFIKKTQQTPAEDIALARKRQKEVEQ
jgi:phage-related protein